MVKLIFQTHDGQEHAVEAKVGTNLMEAARDNNLSGIAAECGGACACATCHVYVAPEWIEKLPEREEMEEDMLDFAWEPDGERSRLSCQIPITESLDGLTVRIPEEHA